MINLIFLLIVASFSTLADDNNVTNSNNVNTSTQSNVIDNTGQDHSVADNSVDSSTHQTTDNSVNSSTGDHRDNWTDNSVASHNQTNLSNQNINNSSTKTVGGNLIDGSNVGTNAGGGNISASGGESSAAASAAGGSSAAQTGDQAQRQKLSSTVIVAPSYHQSYKQVRQAPSVGAVVGIPSSNQRSCKSTVGGGASSPFGGINLIFGDGDDLCETLLIADQMTAFGMPQVACHMLTNYGIDNGIDVARAMAQSGVTCASIQPPTPPALALPTPVAQDTSARLANTPSVDDAIDAEFERSQRK